MAKRLDRTAFLAEPTRLRIAELCDERALTREEIAAELGRTSGSLSQPATMAKHGALVVDRRDRKGVDGRGGARVFRFNRRWHKHLEEARRQQKAAAAPAKQDLLLIPLSETPAACAAIAAGIVEIEWAARVSGERAGLVVAPQPDGNEANTMRVVSALGAVSQLAHLQLGRVMAPDELREWATRVVAGSSAAGELPTGR